MAIRMKDLEGLTTDHLQNTFEGNSLSVPANSKSKTFPVFRLTAW